MNHTLDYLRLKVLKIFQFLNFYHNYRKASVVSYILHLVLILAGIKDLLGIIFNYFCVFL